MLKTDSRLDRSPLGQALFQSLIGMLKTQTGALIKFPIPGFQSLIGMLKTGIHRAMCGGQCCVSIPHRYAENIYKKSTGTGSNEVSIPHRYAENFQFYLYFHSLKAVSIPHRYAENKKAKHRNRLYRFGFNPS